jgi:hypothetical protein
MEPKAAAPLVPLLSCCMRCRPKRRNRPRRAPQTRSQCAPHARMHAGDARRVPGPRGSRGGRGGRRVRRRPPPELLAAAAVDLFARHAARAARPLHHGAAPQRRQHGAAAGRICRRPITITQSPGRSCSASPSPPAISVLPTPPPTLPPPPQSLSVTNGTLTAIPQEMAALSALRELDLHKNELQVFPHQLCGLTGLTVRTTGPAGSSGARKRGFRRLLRSFLTPRPPAPAKPPSHHCPARRST